MKRENCINEQEHEARVENVKQSMPEEERVLEIADIFRMLGEASRLKIVLALMKGESCVYHLVEACGGTQSGVSHQLRVLKDNKIVKSRRAGQSVFYSIADEHIVKMVEIGIEHIDCK